jgi:IS1 family transposase
MCRNLCAPVLTWVPAHPTFSLTCVSRSRTIRNMNRLPTAQRAAVISCLIEGNSVRSVVRITGIAKKTVMCLLVEAGSIAADYQNRVFRNLSCRRIQVDEIWAFIGAKQKNVTPENQARGAVGDIWLWTAVDADTKLVPTWMPGDRNAATARMFMLDLASRLSNRVQLTSDAHGAYLRAVEGAFGHDVDYAQLQKLYGETSESEKRYNPATCIGCKRQEMIGYPDPKHIFTSFVERHNLSVRMTNRRYTRLTNAFSKKIENHSAAVALGYFAYNFIKIHRTLRVTPAMAAGVTDRLWEVSDLVALIEADERGLERAA